MPYRLIQDDDCHWYIIPAGDEDRFHAWCVAMSECLPTGDWEPERVNGPHEVLFDSWMAPGWGDE